MRSNFSQGRSDPRYGGSQRRVALEILGDRFSFSNNHFLKNCAQSKMYCVLVEIV